MSKEIVVTLVSPKGTEYELKATEDKIATIKKRARELGQRIVKIEGAK
jgi:hypothetical protein